MNEPLLWVVGGGGLLGSHMWDALRHHVPQGQLWRPTPPRFSWGDPVRLNEELISAVASFAEAVRARGGGWALLWCAGKGAVNSSAAELEPEHWAWARVLDLLGGSLAGPQGDLPGSIFLASSAGGAYGGNLPELLTEHTPPRPNSEYGAHKLRMEETVRTWSHSFPNVSGLIGRISTLYGPGQDLGKPQGIISHLSRCLLHRAPVSIYVPLDTRRDYLFVDDCADQIAASLSRTMRQRPGVLLKIFASEQLTSLAQIIGVFLRIAKHRSLIVSRQARNPGSLSLKFRSEVWRDLEGLRKTDLASGIHQLHEHQMGLFQRGLLPPPRAAS
jgi:UDP-glucose 4-epimerase